MWNNIKKNIDYFLKKRHLPEYWKEYVETLKNIPTKSIEDSRFVVFDCETSGLNPKEDRILSMGAVIINGNTINIKDNFEIYLEQDVFNRESVPIHGLLKHGKQKKISEEEAIKLFLKYIEGAILVGHHISFDVSCVNYALKRMGLPKLKNRVLDTGILFKKTKHQLYSEAFSKVFSLDEVCDELKVKKKDRHTASGDAYITAIVFFKILGRLNRNNDLTLKELFYTPKMIY
ncbi:DNA polymerase III subunit epsilon [Wenyingzhuangia fucanilytica]|uniref:DNA polymerase III subunit epsilon n=1 Tax=Wenyingzhuangia fucanilytica TaxID=1790137 RepID=A0A1B1Y769_9FLAO|nr:3'-5' exonuclease [Wenyingzhuangia fucanilytica]ANW96589.1 DNA polymerase III subunit epsilon [Wenyingzhuangia fucanilytica]